MTAILAIAIMLSGIFAVIPFAHAQARISLISASPQPITYNFPTTGYAGEIFTVDVNAYNVSGLLTYQIGFIFNQALFKVNAITNGSWLNAASSAGDAILALPPSIHNAIGEVSAGYWSLTSPWSENTTSPSVPLQLAVVTFEILPTVTQAQINTILGVPQLLMGFSTTNTTIQTICTYSDGITDITPLPQNVVNATVTYLKPPPGPVVLPTAVSTITPNPTTAGTAQVFSASSSTAGSNGTNPATILSYTWDWGNGTKSYGVSVTNTYPTPGTYHVTLTVWGFEVDNATNNFNYNVSDIQTANVFAKSTGCAISLYTQNWRYVDPYYTFTTYVGDSNPALYNGSQADTFRPGDLVQLFANATYNGAPVSNALVTFQVFDNTHTSVLVAEATTNCYGLAEWDFRIPWPSTEGVQVNNFTQGSFAPSENTELFGMWSAVVTWQLGSQYTEQPPFEKTQAATMTWNVSWGLSVTIIGISPNPAFRGPNSCGTGSDVVVKVNVENDYLEPVLGLVTGTLYDNLLVPIYPPAQVWQLWPVGNTQYSLASIPIPSYAFVGTAYAVVNLLSTNPIYSGTAFCPSAIAEFAIDAP